MDRLNITCPFRAKYFFGSNNYPRRCHRVKLNKAFSLKNELIKLGPALHKIRETADRLIKHFNFIRIKKGTESPFLHLHFSWF